MVVVATEDRSEERNEQREHAEGEGLAGRVHKKEFQKKKSSVLEESGRRGTKMSRGRWINDSTKISFRQGRRRRPRNSRRK